jgi:ribosome-associated protein
MAGARSIPYTLDESEVEFEAVRAQGSGGQNVNKVSNAAHLRFDLRHATLPEALRQRLLTHADRRIGADGVVRIKAQEHRSLERNRRAALERLRALLDAAAVLRTPRRATRPTLASQRRRVEGKLHRGSIKAGRGRVTE